ncbi:MAG: Fe(3+) ABC transporter substrate-binding protein [Steroidobacteraceae bacterium]
MRMHAPTRLLARLLAALAASLTLAPSVAAAAEPVVVYSARNEQLIKPLFDRFTAETGIPVRFTTADAAVLIERLTAEGKNSPADMLMTVDAGELWNAANRGLLQPTRSKILETNIPATLRDPGNRWVGLSQRARTIVYHPARVDTRKLSTYEDLANPMWRGRLCLRSSKKVYNQSLVAMMIKTRGEAATETTLRGWVANLAAPPFANDNQVMEAIAAGQCDVGIVNTYYLGRLLQKQPDFPVKVFWANQRGDGTHVNVSGAGITRHARNPAGAQKLLEWLSTGDAQRLFAGSNMEYPVNPAIEIDPLVRSWGSFTPSRVNIVEAGRRQAAAVRVMDRAGWR